MNYSDIKELPTAELVARYKEERKRLSTLKFNNAVSQLEQPHIVRETKKTIARFLTEINARRIENELGAVITKTEE